MARKRICIISSGSLSSGPRVEKEADALAAAGHDVHVLVCHTLPWLTDWDTRLAAGKPWTHEAIEFGRTPRSRALSAANRALREVARRVSRRIGSPFPLAEVGLSERVAPLWWRGRRQRADLFIAHNLPALSVAALLAQATGARLAFDAEDDHLGEISDAQRSSLEATLIDAVLGRYLVRCDLVTAASAGIADALANRYGIVRPTVVHNVFPLVAREKIDGQRIDRCGASVSIYWYSQSLGLDRGLQDIARAASLLRGEFELHLRGHAPEDVRNELLRIAASDRVRQRIHFHPQVHPSELLSRCAEHDIGLALEQPVNSNKLNTVSNKLFFYMTAGVAIAATDTVGQGGVLRALPDAGFLYPPGDAAALALGLQRWLDDPVALSRARAAALEAAHTWCWERERETLIATYAALFARAPRPVT